MNNIKIKPGQVMLGTVLTWVAMSLFAYTTAGLRGDEVNLTSTLLQITFYFSLLLSVEAYINMLLNPQWTRVNLGTIMLLCAPALMYLVWYVSEMIF